MSGTPPHCVPIWRHRPRKTSPSVTSSDAGLCKNASACWRSSRTTSSWSTGSRRHPASTRSAALHFLLQTLAPLDVATRGFLEGTKRYEEQRARAEDLADRDEFRTALVNSLQEGFFVSEHRGAVIEINDAFTNITGYPAAVCPTGGRTRGWSMRRRRDYNDPGSTRNTMSNTRPRSGIETAVSCGWRRTSTR